MQRCWRQTSNRIAHRCCWQICAATTGGDGFHSWTVIVYKVAIPHIDSHRLLSNPLHPSPSRCSGSRHVLDCPTYSANTRTLIALALKDCLLPPVLNHFLLSSHHTHNGFSYCNSFAPQAFCRCRQGRGRLQLPASPWQDTVPCSKLCPSHLSYLQLQYPTLTCEHALRELVFPIRQTKIANYSTTGV